MKYRVDITIEGYIEVEADSKEEAQERAEDGFSWNEFNCFDVTVDEVYEFKPPQIEEVKDE